MKTKKFEIPVDSMLEFAEQLIENELTNEIIGTTDEDQIVVEVSYSPDERQSMFALVEWFEDNIEGQEEDDN